MKLNSDQLQALKNNSVNLSNAKVIADHITGDHTVGGIFPNGITGDFSNPDIEKFKAKWCSWWPVAMIVLNIAKIFTNDRVDKVIDALLDLGNKVCKEDPGTNSSSSAQNSTNSSSTPPPASSSNSFSSSRPVSSSGRMYSSSSAFSSSRPVSSSAIFSSSSAAMYSSSSFMYFSSSSRSAK